MSKEAPNNSTRGPGWAPDRPGPLIMGVGVF